MIDLKQFLSQYDIILANGDEKNFEMTSKTCSQATRLPDQIMTSRIKSSPVNISVFKTLLL